jgi:DmsE family decaheme c-type cytochrome
MRQTRANRFIRTVAVAAALWGLMALLPSTGWASDSDCATCHEQLGKQFQATVHGRIAEWETLDGTVGCITCHGDGTAHMDAGGEPGKIRGFGDSTEVEALAEVCTTCHRSRGLHDWLGSSHQLNGVGCTDCHKVHENPGQVARMSETCMSCHADVQAQMQFPSHHPVREGHMSCTSCHNPHGSSAGMLKEEERPQELCYSCHSHLQGPYMFEHDPVFEGCDTCHSPHGSVANNLLVQNEPFLCLQCHELHFHAGLEGEETDTGEWYIPAFDPAVDAPGRRDQDTYPNGMMPIPNGASGYKQAFATKCTQCHTEVHGSDSPSQTVPGFGKGLIR